MRSYKLIIIIIKNSFIYLVDRNSRSRTDWIWDLYHSYCVNKNDNCPNTDPSDLTISVFLLNVNEIPSLVRNEIKMYSGDTEPWR